MTFRLFWFIVGAGTATWWFKHDERKQQKSLTWGQPTTTFPKKQRQCPHEVDSGVTERRFTSWSWSHPPRTQQEAEDLAKFMEFKRQAGDAMTDFSEATLDTLMSTMTAMKTKLAEHRTQREQEQQRMEQHRRDEQPRRWV